MEFSRLRKAWRDSTKGAHALLERANVCRTIAGMLYMPTARVKSLEALVQFKRLESVDIPLATATDLFGRNERWMALGGCNIWSTRPSTSSISLRLCNHADHLTRPDHHIHPLPP
ncbi:hypothetical protein KCV07_g51, partial [Aureobasidium melanogenum]